jgi:hypothetical protein
MYCCDGFDIRGVSIANLRATEPIDAEGAAIGGHRSALVDRTEGPVLEGGEVRMAIPFSSDILKSVQHGEEVVKGLQYSAPSIRGVSVSKYGVSHWNRPRSEGKSIAGGQSEMVKSDSTL